MEYTYGGVYIWWSLYIVESTYNVVYIQINDIYGGKLYGKDIYREDIYGGD